MSSRIMINISDFSFEVSGEEEFVQKIYGEFKSNIFSKLTTHVEEAIQHESVAAEEIKRNQINRKYRRLRDTHSSKPSMPTLNNSKNEANNFSDFMNDYVHSNNSDRLIIYAFYHDIFLHEFFKRIEYYSSLNQAGMMNKSIRNSTGYTLTRLVSRGFLEKQGRGMYKITVQGKEYVQRLKKSI